jgi:cyclophilin family peptidyl-prolyl cis-trans isomerase
MRELAVAANTVRVMTESEQDLEKRSVDRGEEPPIVRFTTRKGAFEAELFEDSAPHAATNFIDLADKHYFDGMLFSPVIGSAIARSGDPRSRGGSRDGPDGPPWKLRRDRSPRQPLLGRLVALATEDGVTHGSQFGILLAPVVADRDSVVVFGQVVKGMDVLQRLEDGDAITKVEVVRRRNHSYDALASRVK